MLDAGDVNGGDGFMKQLETHKRSTRIHLSKNGETRPENSLRGSCPSSTRGQSAGLHTEQLFKRCNILLTAEQVRGGREMLR